MSSFVALMMSGGVDSSISARILRDQGYSLIGVHFLLPGKDSTLKESGWKKVQTICDDLKIPCQLLDVQSIFKQSVIRYFVDSYKEGFTPNPCVMCNKTIKFGMFFDYAIQELKADFVASGHYARIKSYRDRLYIQEAFDKTKDQSYFLFTLPQRVLEKVLFPLGELTKKQVIQYAKQHHFIQETYKESEDLCFVAGHYVEYLSSHLPNQSGNIVDLHGKILGKHTGVHQFTVGQRQGLQISHPEPLYVLALRPQQNEVMVGRKADCFSKKLIIHPVYNIQEVSKTKKRRCTGRVRYRSEKKPCSVTIHENSAEVLFDEPIFAVTPGQMLVLYKDDRVMGGGVIQSGA
ncbi:MAG: tRNA 2-thiouridine(34) synthase MnmA [Caldisericia bacterium]|nr:tRNA 2-thiouridine(34) synthase MnmA [Caldisericia bacterium]